MTEIDKALTVLERKLDDLTEEERSYQRRIDAIALERAAVAGELKGIALARELFATEVSADDATPTRRSIQRPVMALFGQEKGTWTEASIIKKTGLPAEAVHKFLLRAVMIGMLRRLNTYRPGDPNAEYGLSIVPVVEELGIPER